MRNVLRRRCPLSVARHLGFGFLSGHAVKVVAPATASAGAYGEFMRSRSAALAVRCLQQEDSAERGWAVFHRVVQLGIRADVRFYHVMMTFCRRRMPAKSPDVLEAAMGRVVVNDVLFCTFLSACQAASPPLLQDALDLYSRCGPRSHNVIFGVANICRVCNAPESALFLVNDAISNRVEFSQKLLSLLSAICSEAKNPLASDAAEMLLGSIRTQRIPSPDRWQTWANLIKALLANHRFDAAVEAFELMNARDALLPSPHVYSLLISGLAKGNRLTQAVSLFRRAAERCIDVGAPVYALLISTCGRLRDASLVREIHRHAERDTLLENDFVVSALITAYDHCNDVAAAERVFRLRSEAKSLPNIVTFTSLASVYAHHKMASKALEVLENAKAAGEHPDIRTYTIVLHGFVTENDIPKAMDVFRLMTEHDVRVPVPIFSSLVAACGRCFNLAAVQTLGKYARETQAELCDSNVAVSALVSAYGRCDDLASAEDVFRSFRNPAEPVFNAMIAAYSQHGRLDDAVRTFAEFEGSGRPGSLHIYTNAVSVYAKADRAQDALNVFHVMIEQSFDLDPTVFASLVSSCSRRLGFPVLQSLLRYASESGALHNDIAMCSLVSAFGRWNDLSTVRALQVVARDHSFWNNNTVVCVFISVFAQLDALNDAAEVFHSQYANSAADVSTMNAMIAAYAHAGNLLNAIDVFERHKSSGLVPDRQTLSSLLLACDYAGDTERANQIVSEFKQLWNIPAEGLDGNDYPAFQPHCRTIPHCQTLQEPPQLA